MRILIADDEKNIRESLQRLLELERMEVFSVQDGLDAKRALENQKFDLAIIDLKMPGLSGQELLEWIGREGLLVPVIIISAHGEIVDAVKALKSGAKDFLEKPFDSKELIRKVRQIVTEENRKLSLEAELRTVRPNLRFVGEHETVRLIRNHITKVAGSDSTVLITGESGTGKEIVAREIHERSARASEPFIAVNVGGIPESLIESELFGHEKGAFTSADARKPGLFELAGSGTLFLDEIGDMPVNLQVKLLRVLQDRKIRRLGGTRDIPVNARILSATNRNLEEKVRGGSFREDLFYRLNVIRISIPPLRERLDDIPLLCDAILEKLGKRIGAVPKKISDESIRKLRGYSFPGNVRELENILERALIYCSDDMIRENDIDVRPPLSLDLPDASSAGASHDKPAMGKLEQMERIMIAETLRKWKGNRTRAAKELGISRRTIIYKIQEYCIDE